MKNHGEKELVLRCSTRTDRFHRQVAKEDLAVTFTHD
jgi:hypothetical protein